MATIIDGVRTIIKDVSITPKEAAKYVRHVQKVEQGQRIESVEISLNSDDTVHVDYQIRTPKFERIRRITGYLVGSIDRWNNAKRAEEKERVKHVKRDVYG